MWERARPEDVLRRRPLRALATPFRERAFTYRAYDRFLAGLQGAHVVRLREFDATSDGQRTVVGLRHDVDERLDSALALAKLEHRRGLKGTYFVLHTAPYYRHTPGFAATLRRLQDDLGHEVGLHNDLLTVQRLHHADPAAVLAKELEWLRGHGIKVVGTAAHGSRDARLHSYRNFEVFADFTADGHLRMADFGLQYEAYHLALGQYFSDAHFDVRGRRWHPAFLDVAKLGPGMKTIVLVHPCHWDPTVAAKAVRTVGRLARRAVRAEPPGL